MTVIWHFTLSGWVYSPLLSYEQQIWCQWVTMNLPRGIGWSCLVKWCCLIEHFWKIRQKAVASTTDYWPNVEAQHLFVCWIFNSFAFSLLFALVFWHAQPTNGFLLTTAWRCILGWINQTCFARSCSPAKGNKASTWTIASTSW